MTDARIVRDLLDANLQLTAQVVELAKTLIAAHGVAQPAVSSYALDEQAPQTEFQFSPDDNWEDIPEDADEPEAQVIPFPTRTDAPESPLPLYVTEEEEDLRWRVGAGQEAPQALTDLLKNLRAPGIDIEIKPNGT
jgi:hypothetical protein